MIVKGWNDVTWIILLKKAAAIDLTWNVLLVIVTKVNDVPANKLMI